MDKEKRRTELPEQFDAAPVGTPPNVVSELAEQPPTADPDEREPELADFTGKNTPAEDAEEAGEVEPVGELTRQTEAEEREAEARRVLGRTQERRPPPTKRRAERRASR
jgi:hypothetical protein